MSFIFDCSAGGGRASSSEDCIRETLQKNNQSICILLIISILKENSLKSFLNRGTEKKEGTGATGRKGKQANRENKKTEVNRATREKGGTGEKGEQGNRGNNGKRGNKGNRDNKSNRENMRTRGTGGIDK